ncbi:sialate O-acetylesterase [Aquimarina sp. AU474]|uniref:sialate O-acetylesterase n=1 Tax=Aquimarina sp. AU474 TaxID=2108529 RepID=UPI000D689078|nr:sialate O-acetylesterase [Aquimarina sp. AU474]
MKKMRFIVFTGLFLLSMNVLAQDSNFHIYLCFGQSNMEGQGKIEEQDKIVDNRFQVMQSLDCSTPKRTKGKWYTAIPPLCQCESGLSPTDYFGRTMVKHLPDSIKVGVINVAIGGCDIRLFDKDQYHNYDRTHKERWFTSKIANYNGNPYLHLINLAKLAQKDGVIKGILLHQGETNTGDSLWPKYVNKIYNDMLVELSLNSNDVPLLAGEVFSGNNNCCSEMNEIINKLPEVITTAHIISSQGCPGMDNAHFNSEGYRTLGIRYATQMLSLMGYQNIPDKK